MKIREREIYRYLGYRNQMPDENVRHLIQEVVEDLKKEIVPRSVMRRFICQVEKNRVKLFDGQEECVFESNDLVENLRTCQYVVMFAATLGNAPDKLLMKYEITNMAKAAIVQAAGAEMIEAYCNELQEKLQKEYADQGFFLKPRFSPGYGDLSLLYQKQFFSLLSCEKRIGVMLSDSLLMQPTKSVTALIGITREAEECHIGRCNNCKKKDCEFRDEDNG